VGAVLLDVVLVCGIAFQLFNGGDVPDVAWAVMSIVAAIAAVMYICAAIVTHATGQSDWWYFRRWFRDDPE
jgi:hypothetical protein